MENNHWSMKLPRETLTRMTIGEFQTNGLKFDHNGRSVGHGQLGCDIIAKLVGRSPLHLLMC